MAVSTPSAGLALAAGLLVVLSPCVLPILPILVGRSLRSHRYGPLVLVLGLVAGFAAIGSLLGITASWFSSLISQFRLGAIVLLLILGILAIFPAWSYRLLSPLPISSWLKEPSQGSLIGEFWLGSQLGLLWTPCAGPVLASILVLAAVEHRPLQAFILLLVFGLGAGLPLLGIAYGGRHLSKRLMSLRSHSSKLQRVGGLMVVATAIAILLGWDIQVQLWLAPYFPRLPL